MVARKQETKKILSKDKSSKETKDKKSIVKKQSTKLSPKRVKKTPAKAEGSLVINKKITIKNSVENKGKQKKSVPKKVVKSEVLLPTNMSKRAIEKTIALGKEFDYYFRKPMYQIAYVSAVCFMLVGITIISGSFIKQDNKAFMLSQVFSTDSNLDISNLYIIPDPEFSLVEEIPVQLDSPYKVLFKVTNASEVLTKLVLVGKTGLISLDTETLLENKYRVNIPVDKISSDFYRLKIYVRPLNGETPRVFESNEFHVGSVEQTIEVDSKETTIENIDTTVENSVVDNSLVTIENPDDDLEQVDSNSDTQTDSFSLIKPATGDIISGTKNILVSTSNEFVYIELYARPVQSLTPRFVTLATKRFDQWQFVVDSINLPNGKYEFFAKSKKDNNVIKSKSIILSVENNQLVSISTPEESNSGTTESTATTQNRQLVSIRNSDPENEAQEPYVPSESFAKRESWQLLIENSDEVDALLKRYAIAQQSGDTALIESARQALEEKRKEIVLATLQDPELRSSSDDIDKNIGERIDELKNRVETFERIRSEHSNGETSADADQDGVSDYDETNLYGTNPNEADTDNDGVNDGVEIVRGFNPLDDAIEAVIEFESPKDSIALTQDKFLKIEAISPVINIEQSEEKPLIRAEIRGRGLPNSFVTLYIFSTPTVVTVRTDADGSFVYTYDKELDDGQHDVYVAITDNTGKIIAKSNSFSFIKKAEAFTPVDATEGEVITPETVIESTNDIYNKVIGIGILAFGVILLMLGISLRSKGYTDGISLDVDDTTNKNLDAKENTSSGTKVEHINAS